MWLSVHLFITSPSINICVCEHTFINTQTNLDFYICNLIKKNLKNSGEIFTTFFHSGFNFSQTELLGNFVSRYNRVAFQQWMEQVLPATVQCPLIDGGRCRQSLPSLGFSCSGSEKLVSFSMALLHSDNSSACWYSAWSERATQQLLWRPTIPTAEGMSCFLRLTCFTKACWPSGR